LEWEHKKENIKLYDIQWHKEVKQAGHIIGWCGLEDGEILLDLACGTGDPSRGIAARYPNVEVVGIDITKTRTRQGKDWALEDGLANIHFVVGDVDNLPFRESLFNIVTCVGAFQHFPNPLNTLCETARILKLGGRLVLNTVLVPDDQEGYDFINNLSRLGAFPGGFLGYPSKTELKRMLKACGFRYRLILQDEESTALTGEKIAKAARLATPELQQRFKIEVIEKKVFFNYPNIIVTAVGEKIRTVSKPKDIPKPRYLIL